MSRGSERQEAWLVTRQATGGWSKPTRLSASLAGDASTLGVVVSATGETTVTWSETSTRHGRTRVAVLVRTRRANHWEPEHVLAAVSDATSQVYASVGIALSHTGAPVVIFGIGRSTSAEAVEVDRRAPNGRWPRPRVVARTAYCERTRVAIDPEGELLLAWMHGNPISPGSLTRVEALTLSRNLRPQSGPVALSPTGRYAYAPNIAVNARGDATLVWAVQGHESQPLNAPLEAATRTSGDPFTRVVGQRVISGDGSLGGVAVDSQGEATVVFSAGEEGSAGLAAVATRPLAGRWGVPVPISTAPVLEPVLGQDATEDLLAAWTIELPAPQGRSRGPYAIQASVKMADGAWQTPTIISPAHSNDAAVAIEGSNHGLAAWENEATHRIEAADLSL